jgi:hypothetical protein
MDQPRYLKSLLAETQANTFGATNVMRLFKSTFTPTQLSVLADFDAQEVDFTGYAEVAIPEDWAFGLSPAGLARLIYGGLAIFTQTDVLATDIAGGWYIKSASAGTLLLAGVFEDPVIFDATGNQALVKPSIEMTMESLQDLELIVGP